MICSIRLVRFWAERKRSFSNWKIAQISARPMTTRSDARSPWIEPPQVSPRVRRSCSRSVAGGVASLMPSSPAVFRSLRVAADPVIAETTCSSVVCSAAKSPAGAAEPQHEDAVGDLEDVGQVVADHDDAEPALAQPPDQVEHLRRLGDAERGGGLVEQHDLRLAQQRAGDRDLLALARRRGGPTSQRTLGIVTARLREQLARPVLHARLVELARDRARARARPPRGRGTGWRRRRGCRRAPGPGRRSRSPGRRRPGAWRSRPARPSKRILPSSAAWMPAIDFTSVDLPAPLSPTRATTSPASTAKSTRSRAWTGPNRLLTPSSASSGAPSCSSSASPRFPLLCTPVA